MERGEASPAGVAGAARAAVSNTLFTEVARLKKLLDASLPPQLHLKEKGAQQTQTQTQTQTQASATPSPASPLASAKQTSVAEALAALAALEKLQVDRPLLAKSRIGLTVAALRRHSDAQVKSRAAALVAKWKSAVGEKESSSASRAGSDAKKKAAPSSPASAPQVATQQPTSFASADFAGPFSGNATRDKARVFLWKALVEGAAAKATAGFSLQETSRIAADVEEALWSAFVERRGSSRDYNAQLKTLKFNLADPKNPDLNVKVLWGVYAPAQLATMTSAELASDAKKKEREAQKQESLEACQSDWEVRRILSAGDANSGQFPCFKCRTNKTVYFQMQTRSSDEPMTTFVNCLECGNRWKF